MSRLAENLFREVKTDFFRILTRPLAALYVEVLDALEIELAHSNQGIDRDEALALTQEIIDKHADLAEVFEPDTGSVVLPNNKARLILETLRKAGWIQEEQRSDWQRLIYFEPSGAVLLQALRQIAFSEAAFFSDKLVNVCTTLSNRRALAEEPWPQIESSIASLQAGLAELRVMQKSIERHTKQQLAATTLKENLALLFDQFAERIGRTCYAELVQARLPSKLAAARRDMDELENDFDLLIKMQTEVIRRAPSLSSEDALAHVRLRLNELRELLDQIEPLADAIDRRTADFARRSQARFRYLQETASDYRRKVQTFFETINTQFGGRRVSDLDGFNIEFPSLLLHDVRVPWGLDSLYTPRVRHVAGEIEPLDDSDPGQQRRTLTELEYNMRDSLTVSRANQFVSELPGGRGALWDSANLLEEHIHNDEDMASLIACLLHARSADAKYEITVPRCEAEADMGTFDSKMRYRVERFVLAKK